MKKFIFSLVVFATLLMMVGLVSASHETSLSNLPTGWTEPGVSEEYTITVTNEGGEDIQKVTITIPDDYSNLDCGDAPTGWGLDSSGTYSCVYTTSSDFIEEGESEEFTLEATTPAISENTEKTWLVMTLDLDGDTESNQFTIIVQTIQNAIDTWDGINPIVVPAGTYSENIVIDEEGLVLTSEEGADETVIDGKVSGTVVTITADDVEVSGFTITGFMTYTSETTDANGNIEIDSSVDNVFEGNGIFLDSVSDCVIENNIIRYESGIGIRLQESDDNIIQNNVIEDSYVSGIAVFGSSSNAIEGNSVTGSIQVKSGGNNMGYGIWLDYSPPEADDDEDPVTRSTENVIDSNTFSDNDVDGVYFGKLSDGNTLTNNIITDNGGTYKKDSDGVYFWKSSENIVTGNTITGNTKSGIELKGSHDNVITENTITGNNGDTEYYESKQGAGILIRWSNNDINTVAGNVINENTISDNLEYNIYSDSDVAINAEYNWWGTSVESEIQALVSGDVDYDPWCYDELCELTESYDWIIPLYANEEGNYFSIPLTPESTDIEDVLPESVSDNAEKIWSYQQGEWIYNTPTSTGWSSATSRKLQEIEPGYGYIIFMEENAVVYGDAKTASGEPVTPSAVELTTGWNLIGHYGLNVVNKSEETGDLSGNDQLMDLANINLLDSDGHGVSELEPNAGYWAFITGEDTVWYAPSTADLA